MIDNTNENLKTALTLVANQDNARKKYLIEGVKTVPVPDTVFSKLIIWGVLNLYEIMNHHPGHDLNEKIKSLHRMLETYKRSFKDLLTRLDEFDLASKDKEFAGRLGTEKLNELTIACRKEIFCLACSASALIMSARHVTKNLNFSDFKQIRESIFDGSQNKFVTDLRNNLNHEIFVLADWSLKNLGDGQTSHFEFSKDKLLRDGSFSVEAKIFIEEQKEQIDVRELFEDYDAKVEQLYKWFLPEIEKRLPEEVIDYRRCVKAMRGNASSFKFICSI